LNAARTIVDEAAEPNVGLVIDAFHFHVGGSRIADLDGLDRSSVFIIHLDDAEPGEPAGLTDAQRVLPGEGVIPLKALVRGVEETGFDGFYSLELFRPEYWRWDPGELARRGLERMRSLFSR
jgi:2-keto-myo-inositol isomerase